MIRTIFLLLSAALLTSCSGPFNPFADTAGREIFPVEKSVTWVYRVNNINAATYYNVDRIYYWYTGKAETYWGDSVWILNKNAVDTAGNSIWSYDNIYIQVDDFGYYSYSQDLSKDYPIKFLDFPVYEGKKWSSNAGEDGKYYFSVYDSLEGTVEGKFSTDGYDDCWRIKVTLMERENSSGFKYEYIRWYKENVGLIKDSQWIYDEYGYYAPVGVILLLDSLIEE